MPTSPIAPSGSRSNRPRRSRRRTRSPRALIALIALSALAVSALLLAPPTSRIARAGERALETVLADSGLPDSARAETVVEDGVPQLIATLLVSTTSPARIGVLFELAPGWHLYWRNPGETGVAPEIELEASGHEVGALDWPVPETFREADDLFTTYGYEGRVLLSAELGPASALTQKSASDAPASQPVARAQAAVLVCRTQCVPATFTLESPLDLALAAPTRDEILALFTEAGSRLPRPASTLGWVADASWVAGAPAVDESHRLALSVDARGTAMAFIPLESEVLEFGRQQPISIDATTGRMTLEVEVTRLEAGEDRLRGLVAVQAAGGETRHAEIDVPIGVGHATAAPGIASPSTPIPTPSPPLAWLRIVLLALLGGVILNGMPCVLPVLAIKVVSVADMAERDPREVRLHGLAYTAGVLGSMLALACIVLALRGAGHAVGWGFQFQEPLFVAGIAALLVTFALNLFGVFEIELGQGDLAAVGQHTTGLSRSVFEGLLAVVLATPCTAPFLGTAVGFAFASSGYGIVAIFVAIGAGLASPFLIVSFFPRLARFIPRSGPWMLKLRAGLGFCLLATVVWLLWIMGQSGGTDTVVAMLMVLLFLGFLLWIFGQLQPMRRPWLGRASALGIAVLAFASFNRIDFEPSAPASTATGDPATAAADGFAPYSDEAVRASLAAGVPAFVVFTADWCITCKVNERTVLDRPAVREALARAGFALFRADWTRRDDTIRTKLAEFGRAGVPLYLVYDPAKPDEPRVLSELLSQEAVLAALALPVKVGRI